MSADQDLIIKKLRQQLKQSNLQLKQTKQKYNELKFEVRSKDDTIQRNNKTMKNQSNRIRNLESLWDPKVLRRGGTAQFMHAQNIIELAINDDSKLRRTISMTKERFDDVCARVAELSRGDDLLFYGDGSPRHGNRCRLSRDQTVYMSILLKKADPRQVDLETLFGICQSTVSRAVEYIDGILVQVLPTANVIQQRIRHADLAKLDQFVPDNELMTDGTEMQVRRPQDDAIQKKYYSGKKKRHTAKSTIVINRNGLIIYAGPPHEGSTNDMKMLQLDDPDLGIVTRRMKSGLTPDSKKVVSWSDLGYYGIDKFYPGIMLLQPIKRPRKKKGEKESGKLAPDEKRHNKRVSSVRIRVEHAIGRLKHFAVLRNVYVGSNEHLDRDLQIISGLVNHRMLWDRDAKKLRLGL